METNWWIQIQVLVLCHHSLFRSLFNGFTISLTRFFCQNLLKCFKSIRSYLRNINWHCKIESQQRCIEFWSLIRFKNLFYVSAFNSAELHSFEYDLLNLVLLNFATCISTESSALKIFLKDVFIGSPLRYTQNKNYLDVIFFIPFKFVFSDILSELFITLTDIPSAVILVQRAVNGLFFLVERKFIVCIFW